MDFSAVKEMNQLKIARMGLWCCDKVPPLDRSILQQIRPAEEVARRAIVCGYLCGLAYEADREEIMEHLQKYALWESLNEAEKRYFFCEKMSESDRLNCVFISEQVQVFCWVMEISTLELDKCDDDLLIKLPVMENPFPFIMMATLRKYEEILAETDFYIRLWKSSGENKEIQVEKKINIDMIQARADAFKWLCRIGEEL